MINKKDNSDLKERIEKEFDKLLPKVDVVRIKAVFSNTKDEVSQTVAAETHNTQVEIVKQLIFKTIEKVLDERDEQFKELVNRKFERGERRWCIECANRLKTKFKQKRKEMDL